MVYEELDRTRLFIVCYTSSLQKTLALYLYLVEHTVGFVGWTTLRTGCHGAAITYGQEVYNDAEHSYRADTPLDANLCRGNA